MKKTDKILNITLPLLTVFCIILIWCACAFVVSSEYILPDPKQTLAALISILQQGKFYVAFLLTLLRSIIAFLLSFIIAGVSAFWAQKSKKAERVILTIISILRALPTVSIVLLLLFWTDNQVAPIVVTMLVVMPTTYTHLKGAFDGVDKGTVEASMVDGADKMQSFFKVELPQITPMIYSAVGSGISLNFKLMVAAEVLSATVKSIGNLLNIAKYNGEIAQMLAMVIVAVVFGIIIEFVFNKLSQKAGNWK